MHAEDTNPSKDNNLFIVYSWYIVDTQATQSV